MPLRWSSKLFIFFRSMIPDYERVVHITEPADGFVSCLIECRFSKSSMMKLSFTGDSGEPMVSLSLFS
jgi:hypothetical protein